MLVIREKSGHAEEPDRGTFWRGTTIDIDTRLRVARAIEKNEEEVALTMMSQIRDRSNPIEPSAIASDGCDGYPEALLEASCAWEDWVYNLTRKVKSLRIEARDDDQRLWKPRSPAMAAGLTDHIWTIEELLSTMAVPDSDNAK